VEHFILNLSLEQQIALIVLAVVLFIHVLYNFIVYIRPFFWKRKEVNDKNNDISVIICAKNEYENLKNNLPKILEQDYANYEVIVVNDCSTDDSEMLLGELEQKYKHLRHTTIEPDIKFSHGKKLAITIGIKSAKYEHLVFTDADCHPVSNRWLKELDKSYIADKQLVIGYGGYERRKGLLNKIIRYDTLTIAMQYLGFAIVGRPYMGVGRNLSYLKKLFFSSKGFARHYQMMSGDDDLFVNDNANKRNASIVLSPDSFTVSKPQESFRKWAKQKKRHLTTGRFYKKTDKFFLVIEPLTRFLFYISLLYLIYVKTDIIIVASIYLFRMIIQMVVIKLNMIKMREKGFLLLIPIFDVLLPIMYFFFMFSNKKKYIIK
jgi:glycosyltransferase involved in cell wall biosynthesis